MLFAPLALVCCAASLTVPQEAENSTVRAMPWQMIGPFQASAAPATTQRLAPERMLREMEAGAPWPALTESFDGKRKTVLTWEQIDPALVSEVMDLQALLGGAEQRKSAVLLYRQLHVRTDMPMTLFFGSDDGLRVWVNGKSVLQFHGERDLRKNAHRVSVQLKAGVNHLLVKCVTKDGRWRLSHSSFEGDEFGSAAVNAAIDRGAQFLIARQLADGSWPDYRQAHAGGIAGLSLYTLIKCGLAPEHPTVQRGLNFLRTQNTSGTYATALMIMGYAAVGDPSDRGTITTLARLLESTQCPNGLWGYPSGSGDLSCTQYAALGLRAAAQSGYSVSNDTWSDLVRGVRGCRAENGGFGYAGRGGASASMTAAGVGTLAICKEQLTGGSGRKSIQNGIDSGIEWLSQHCALHSAPRNGGWSGYYMIYGLERAGGLSGEEHFGNHAWYPEGVEVLLTNQAENGGWKNDLDSCFSLLFLRRATTRPLVAPITPVSGAHSEAGGGSFLASSRGAGPLQLKISLQAPQRMWIARDSPAFDDTVRVVYWVMPPDGAWAQVPAADEDRFATLYGFGLEGDWQVRANGFYEDGTSVATGIVEVSVKAAEIPIGGGVGVTGSLAERLTTSAAEELRERFGVLSQRDRLVCDVKTSSFAAGAVAVAAVDQQLHHGWRCARGDAAPRFRLTLSATKQTGRLMFSQAPMLKGDSVPRPLMAKLSISIDGGPETILSLANDPAAIGVLKLPERKKVKSVEIRVLEVHNGELGTVSVGIGELLLD